MIYMKGMNRYSFTKLWPASEGFRGGRKTSNLVKKTCVQEQKPVEDSGEHALATLVRGEASDHCAMIYMFHNFSHQ